MLFCLYSHPLKEKKKVKSAVLHFLHPLEPSRATETFLIFRTQPNLKVQFLLGLLSAAQQVLIYTSMLFIRRSHFSLSCQTHASLQLIEVQKQHSHGIGSVSSGTAHSPRCILEVHFNSERNSCAVDIISPPSVGVFPHQLYSEMGEGSQRVTVALSAAGETSTQGSRTGISFPISAQQLLMAAALRNEGRRCLWHGTCAPAQQSSGRNTCHVLQECLWRVTELPRWALVFHFYSAEVTHFKKI